MSDETKAPNAPNPLARQYRGHEISVSLSDLKFHITGPEFDQYKAEFCTFNSFDEARAKIDTEVEGAQKLRAQNLKFRETVLDKFGIAHLILSINRGTGKITGLDGDYVYPNVTWVAEDLKRAREIRLELNTIENRISPLKIQISRGYGRIDVGDYPERLESLSRTINEKLELANQSIPANPEADTKVVELKTS